MHLVPHQALDEVPALPGVIQAAWAKSQLGAATRHIVEVRTEDTMEEAEIIIEGTLVGSIVAITDGSHIGPIGP
jgi:hypothetical protein